MPISRAAAEIEPVSRMLSSSLALPGPMRAPDSKTALILHPRHIRQFATDQRVQERGEFRDGPALGRLFCLIK